MVLSGILKEVSTISILCGSSEVVRTAAELLRQTAPGSEVDSVEDLSGTGKFFFIAVWQNSHNESLKKFLPPGLPDQFIYLKIDKTGNGGLVASHPYYLHGFVQYLLSDLINSDGA